jgi:hypothetical protein
VWAAAGRNATLVLVGGEVRVWEGALVAPPDDAYRAVRAGSESLARWRRDATG